MLALEQSEPDELPTHILLDLMLSDAGGVVLLQYVRRRQLPIRVALLTAAGPHSDAVAEATQLPPDAAFHKPALFADIEVCNRLTAIADAID